MKNAVSLVFLVVLCLVLLVMLGSCSQNDSEILLLDQGWMYALAEADHGPDNAAMLQFQQLDTGYIQNLEKLIPGGEGYIWLRSEFPRPDFIAAEDQKLLSIYLGRITMADRTFVNGAAVGSTGRFPPNLFSAWNMHRAYNLPVELLEDSNTLLIKIYVGNEGAVVGNSFIAEHSLVERQWRLMTFISSYLNMGISLVMLVISLYHLWLFLKRTQERENLYFSLLNFSGAVYLMNFFIMHLPGYESWTGNYLVFQRIVANVMLYVLAFCTVSFVRSFLRRQEHRFLKYAPAVLLAIPALMALLLPDYAALREYRSLMLAFLIPVLLYVIYMLFDSARKKNRDAIVLLVGISPLFLTALADIVLHNFLSMYQVPYIGGFGFPLMIFSLLFILAGRFAEARTEVEDLNINLEQKVEQRTEELQIANTTLEDTLAQLQAAQDIAARDMEMAVRVQQSFYPKKAPVSDAWSSGLVFQPASGVAGDLYDFFHDDHCLQGAVLFDVSGHGISSGLVAMLAKAIIARGFLHGSTDKLSHIMQRINTSLIDEKGEIENYMTGIMIRVREDLVEAVSAGHPEILLFDPENCRTRFIGDESSQGSIVGIPGLPTDFPMMRFRMKQGTMLLAYSDALNESCNEDGEQFGQDGIIKTLSRAPRGMSSQEVADYLSAELYTFMGAESTLKDDLTILALQYQGNKEEGK